MRCETVDHRGGLDAFLLKAKDADLAPKMLELKRQIVKKKAPRRRAERGASAAPQRLTCGRPRRRSHSSALPLSRTSANCSSRLRWRTEKLSSDTSVMMVSPSPLRCTRDAFHVVDLVGEVGLDQRLAVDQRARLDVGERDAADAHGDAAHQRIAALQQQQDPPAAGSVQSLTSKSSLRLTLKRSTLSSVEQIGRDDYPARRGCAR